MDTQLVGGVTQLGGNTQIKSVSGRKIQEAYGHLAPAHLGANQPMVTVSEHCQGYRAAERLWQGWTSLHLVCWKVSSLGWQKPVSGKEPWVSNQDVHAQLKNACQQLHVQTRYPSVDSSLPSHNHVADGHFQ